MAAGAAWAQNNLSPEVLAQLPLPSESDWQQLWTGLRATLDGASLDRAADLMPYAEIGIQYLNRIEGGDEYAAWLRQRLDYLEMANAIVRRYPVPQPSPRVARPPPRDIRIVPPVPPPPSAIPAAVWKQRETAACSTPVWRKALSRRPAPAAAGELVPRLKQAFRAEGVPPQLVWIAEVESSMNPNARNPGGATGLFQFMPATAQRFGLRTWPFDERRHPEKSARAAARYLRFLHGEFRSWPLALAGYNAGEGRVKALLARTRGTSFADIADLLPVETRMYVPKVQAVVELREGVDAARLPPPSAAQASILPFYLAGIACPPHLRMTSGVCPVSVP